MNYYVYLDKVFYKYLVPTLLCTWYSAFGLLFCKETIIFYDIITDIPTEKVKLEPNTQAAAQDNQTTNSMAQPSMPGQPPIPQMPGQPPMMGKCYLVEFSCFHCIA